MSQVSPDIAVFLRSLSGGGAERVMLNLARNFSSMGFNVDLLLARCEGPYLKDVPPDIRLVDLKSPQVAMSLPKLITYLRRYCPTSLLTGLHYPSEIALWAKRLSGVSTRVVVSERNHLSMKAKNYNQLSVRLTPLMARLFYPWADGITTVSRGLAEDLAKITGLPLEQIEVIYNPTITPEISVLAEMPVEHPWFSLGEPPVILGVGRLYPQKDFSTLIRAFARIRKALSARLMILGTGPEEAKLKALVQQLGLEDAVAMPGFVDNPYAYMAKSSVLAMSSVWEGLGNVLIEAMAVGTPVVSTDCPSGPAEILNYGEYGVLTPVGNDCALADGILSVLSEPKKLVDPSWLEQFTPQACTHRYLDVLGLS